MNNSVFKLLCLTISTGIGTWLAHNIRHTNFQSLKVSNVWKTEENLILKLHNDERILTKREVLFSWDDRLSAGANNYAQTLAKTNKFEHSNIKGVGENLFKGTQNYFKPEEMVKFWIAEKSNFKPGIFPDVAKNGLVSRVGHYTQIIWNYTKSDNPKLGCGSATGNGYDYLVCWYSPQGNILNQRVYPIQ